MDEEPRFSIARFEHKRATRPRRSELTLPTLRALLGQHRRRNEKDGELWSPVRYRPGTQRGNENVEQVSCFVVDMDDGTPRETIEGAWSAFCHLGYSTFSSTPDAPKYHVVFPLLLPVPAVEWPVAYRKLMTLLLRGLGDPSTKDVARMFYLPSCPPESEPFTWFHEGRLVDWRNLPGANILDETPRPTFTVTPEPEESSGQVATSLLLDRARDQIAEIGRNNAGFWLACQLRDNGYSETEAGQVLETFRAGCPAVSIKGDADAYTSEEAQHSLQMAYRRAARLPWDPPRQMKLPAKTRNGKPSTKSATAGKRGEPRNRDLQLAQRFAEEHRERVAYLAGDQWWFYESDGAWRHRGLEHAQEAVQRWLVRQVEADPKLQVARERVTGVMFLAKSLLGPRDIGEFDARADWIPLRNGVLDLATMRLRDHAAANQITRLLPYDYDPKAQCPLWISTLDQVLIDRDGNPCREWIELQQEWYGYCLLATAAAQTSMFWIGEGANGKGVMERVLSHLVGEEQVASIDMDHIHDPYHRAELYGKLVAVISEVDRKAMTKNGQMFKAIVGGDKISARRVREAVFYFRPYVRIVTTCNNLPATNDLSHGYFRRFMMIEFRRQFSDEEQIKDLDRQLFAEASGIFNWALEGLKRLQARGFRFEIPEESRVLVQNYRRSEDSFEAFYRERVETAKPGDAVSSSRLYGAYKLWCDANGYPALTGTWFGRRLGQRGLVAKLGRENEKRVRCWVGIQLHGELTPEILDLQDE